MGEDWKQELRYAFQNVNSLLKYLFLHAEDCPFELRYQPQFPFRVPASFAMRMAKRRWRDPLLLQVLPTAEEEKIIPGFSPDPLQETKHCDQTGLLKKYRNRALLLSSAYCAVNCRFCFRRHFDFEGLPQTGTDWHPVWQALGRDSEIEEVILSGGDPFLAETKTLNFFLQRLSSLNHVHTVRFHTRMPVILPSRINRELISLITRFQDKPFKLVAVLHANHPNELKGDCLRAIANLKSTGILLLNQSVLLRDINDNANIQIALSKSLLQAGVFPYYLHQMDRVQGAHHFEVPEEKGKAILSEMKSALPGYAIPRYVRDLPGETCKSVIA